LCVFRAFQYISPDWLPLARLVPHCLGRLALHHQSTATLLYQHQASIPTTSPLRNSSSTSRSAHLTHTIIMLAQRIAQQSLRRRKSSIASLENNARRLTQPRSGRPNTCQQVRGPGCDRHGHRLHHTAQVNTASARARERERETSSSNR
jgi:hypothetical protein